MGVVNEENPETASLPIARDAVPLRAWPPEDQSRFYSPARRVAFLLLVLVLFGGAVAMQAVLGTYAVSGLGVAAVRVPPEQTALALLACIAVAVALSWGNLRARVRSIRSAGIAPSQEKSVTSAPPLWRGWAQAAPALPARLKGALRRAPLAPPRVWFCAWLTTIALIISLIADVAAWPPDGRPMAQWWWVASVIVLALAAGVLSWPFTWWRALLANTRHLTWALAEMLLVAGLLVVGLELRLPGLIDQPYVVHGDEAACGLEALRWLHGGVPSLLSVGWYGLPVAGYGLPALVMRVAGADLFGLRLSSVIIGLLCVVLLYALAREFVGRRVAFVAAALFTVAHISIQFSRMGIHYIHAPFVVLLTLWMLARSLRTRSALAAVLAGVGLSLSIQVYFSARIVLLIVPLFVLGLALLNREALRGRLSMLGWLVCSFVVSFGPLGVFFWKNPAPLEAHSAEVLILNQSPITHDHLISQFGTADFWRVLMHQLAAVPLYLGGLPDQSLQYGPQYPLFDAMVAALGTIGFFYALLHLRRPLHLLLVVWVTSTVIVGGVLTIDQPWWPRLFVMVPALCLLAALALEKLLLLVQRAWRGLEWSLVPAVPGRRFRALALGTVLALVVIGYSAGQSARWYFVDYSRQIANEGWRAQYTYLGRYLAEVPAGTQVVLLSDNNVLWNYYTLQFLAPQVRGQRVGSASQLRSVLNGRSGPVVVLITLSKQDEFQQLLNTPGALPAGKYAARPGLDGYVAFFTYQIGGG
ncbi:MAG TPA: glycosyltransferase family 39 protein [Ktedonobacterales bacterium]|jgi:4-amino-4-deoxy-L-arabinose transferase-like glycosyltransferase